MSRWLQAARPQTLTAAISPVLVGAALAYRDDVFAVVPFLAIVVAALSIQVGVNFANDLADARSGADNTARIGPTRAVSTGLISPAEMRRGIAAAFGLASLCGLYLIFTAGWVIAVIGVLSIVAALAYTAGPWPYGYRGFGEVFVFLFFGLAATAGTRYVFDRSAPADAWVARAVMGLLAAAILEANNIRDLDTDRVAQKMTLAVMLGRRGARALYASTLAAVFAVLAVGLLGGVLPPWSALALLAIPLAVPLVRTVFREASGPPLIGVLVGTARLQMLIALLMGIGALIP